MVRKLKFHEKKLLKKVDFISWDIDDNVKELKIMKRYRINNREDLTKSKTKPLKVSCTYKKSMATIPQYKKIARKIRILARKIKKLQTNDPFRGEATLQLLEKLYNIGLIRSKHSLQVANMVNCKDFCRRRLPVMLVRKQMAQNMKTANKFVEQGHIRIGPEVITDVAFLVNRHHEDFITWTDTSKIRQHVLEYNDMRDDFDIMG